MDKKRNWRAIFTWALAIFSVLYAVPSFIDVQGSWYPFQKEVRGGLDLAGGLELRYTVDWKQAVEDATAKVADNLRTKIVEGLAAKANLSPGDLSKDQFDSYAKRIKLEQQDIDKVVLTMADDEVWAVYDALDNPLDQIDNRFEKSESSSDRTVTVIMPDSAASEIHTTVVKETRSNLEKRVGGMGLIDPDVRITGDSDIAVQIPGVGDNEMDVVRAVLGRTAQLTMRYCDQQSGAFFNTPEVKAKVEEYKKAHPDAADMIVDRGSSIPGYVIKAKNKGALARFTRLLTMPSDHMIGFHYEDGGRNNSTEKYWEAVYLVSKVELTGSMLARARMNYNEKREIVVLLDFNSEGSRVFADTTEKNVGQNLAIMLDEDIQSAPTIIQKIVGTASITVGGRGMEAQNEARALMQVLNQGAYQAPVYKVHDYKVGPSLGADSVTGGALSLLIAFLINVTFVGIYYRRSGLIAATVLGWNTLLMFVVLVSMNTALTLAGVAGIVLTVGTAIDGNIIIYERIRDELRAGKTPRAAVDLGFEKAFSAIIDGNLTTAITAFVLMNFTSGAIHNFAVTMLIGLTTSVFTSVVVSRLLFNWWLKRKPAMLSI